MGAKKTIKESKKPKPVTSKTFTKKAFVLVDEDYSNDLTPVHNIENKDFYDTKELAKEDADEGDDIVEITLSYTLKKHSCNCNRCSSK